MENKQSLHHLAELLGLAAGRVNGGDLTTLTDLFPLLETIEARKGVPTAFHSQCNRVRNMIETAILGDQPMDSMLVRLKDVLPKMQEAVLQLPPEEVEAPKANHPPVIKAPIKKEKESQDTYPLDMDLIHRFITSQKEHLDDLEVFALEMEKGNGAAREEIRRYLHTLKGEFGVLNLGEYSGVVHDFEDVFHSGQMQLDQMFAFKDWVQSILPDLSRGQVVPVSSDVMNRIGIVHKEAEVLPELTKSAMKSKLSIAGNFDISFYTDFINESREHLYVVEAKLLTLEAEPTSEEPLHAVFRSYHTIKGLAGFLELGDMQTFAHAVETLMDKARNREISVTPQLLDVLLECTDTLKEMIHSLEQMIQGKECAELADLAPLLHKVQQLGQVIHIEVPANPLSKVGEILVDAGLVTASNVTEAVELQKAGDERKLGEILVYEQKLSPQVVDEALKAQATAKQHSGPVASVEESVRVPVGRLDQLIDAIGEAVIAQSMIVADAVISDLSRPATSEEREDLRRKVARAELVMRQIQELSMSLRMVSVKSVFQKMARLVRDLSKKLDKKVELILEGENTELDKTVVENIGDPLVHMIRNALDHGIESSEERRQSGKDDSSHLILRAFHKAGNVYIEVEDDGRGISRDKVVKKAVEQGLIPSGVGMSDAEVYMLLFRPGFSTAAAVTDLSGRGVGMDVVKRNIEALRGSVEVNSTFGRGSRFTIRLPLTLAIIDGMVVRIGRERFIVPTLQVVETLRPKTEQMDSILGKGEIIQIRKEIVRVIRLNQLLGVRGACEKLEDGVVMVVEDVGGARCGIAVDEILEQQQVVIKNMGGSIAEVPGISGGAIMNNGEVSLILDISGIVRLSMQK